MKEANGRRTEVRQNAKTKSIRSFAHSFIGYCRRCGHGIARSLGAWSVDVNWRLLLLDVQGKRKNSLQTIGFSTFLIMFGITLLNIVAIINIMTLGIWWIPAYYCFAAFEAYMVGLVMLWLYGEPAGAS